MKRDRISTIVLLVALGGCTRDERSNWTLGLSFGGFPIQTVVLTAIAQDFPSELTGALSPSCASLAYSVWASARSSRTSIVNSSFLPIRRYSSSSLPAAVSKTQPPFFFTSGIGTGQLFGADIENDATLIVVGEPMHFLVATREVVARVLVRDWISR